MDGNNRWSKKNEFSKYLSYKEGANKLIKISKYIFDNSDTKYVSAFALSKNNLNRSTRTINMIKKILLEYLISLKDYHFDFDVYFKGDFNFLEKNIREKIYEINKLQKYKKKFFIYLNYGGREDILSAAKNFNNQNYSFKDFLFTKDIPDPEILIRTGGYNRISNFFLYQIAFTEYFLKKLYDIIPSDIRKIINSYYKIDRKYGL